MPNTELRNIALFIDFENFGQHDTFDTRKLVDKLKERGRLIIKRAYADWGRFSWAKRPMLENSVDLIEMPSRTKGKNAADIRLVVDALETAITKDYVDTIVVVSGDSDYTPLISKLREYNKYVIVVGGRQQTSRLLVGYCDELIFYSNLVGEKVLGAADINDAFDLLVRAVSRLEDQGFEVRSSQLKPYMKQLDATFDESNYGFPQFKLFLERAAQEQLVEVEDTEHGNFLVKLKSGNPTLSAANKAAKSPHETHDPKLLHLIYWAYKINELEAGEGVMLGNLVQTIRSYLEPDFDFASYGYSRNRGFKGIFEDLQNYGYVRLVQNNEKNQLMVFLERPILFFGRSTTPPDNYLRLHLESACARQGLSADLRQISLLAHEAARIQKEAAENGRTFTTQELFNSVRNQLQEQDKHAPYKRIVNTIIQSGSLYSTDSQPIESIDDKRPIAPLPQNGQIVQNCALLIKQILVH
ncbi:MAG: NYN domain-containing protein [Candidatus Promineifilaceae bacterium]